jgi:hypothetical protein
LLPDQTKYQSSGPIFVPTESTTNLIYMSTLLPTLFITAFHAILFCQSGLDKVLNYKGNLNYFKDHFKGSILAPGIVLLLPVITFLELSAGCCAAWGGVQLLLGHGPQFAFYGAALAATALLALFFGQRVAQDYAGAATLVPYFLVAVTGLVLSY